MTTTYHVAKNGSDDFPGTQEKPFLTIQQAANVAQAGDTISVHQGEYREWVKPKNAGLSPNRRITYQAAPGETVVIKGSEQISDWTKGNGNVWQKEIPNAFFGDFNPFKEEVWGDWVTSFKEKTAHLGEVYLNGQALYEVSSLEAVKRPKVRTTVQEFFIFEEVAERYPEKMKYVWYAEVTETKTILYANFQEFNPNQEKVEINVRPTCFYPERTGIDYISLIGFEICQTACGWAPPTGNQPGMVGPHWSKGWLIKDNLLHDAKCSAISLGKVADSGDNYYSHRQDKPGYTYQLESVFTALRQGWTKGKIGSHTVCHNHIYDCGQNGIVGHMGAAFSNIYDNHIHDISMKREFYGWEIAGIKLHAAIDVDIKHNYIHDCSCGTWLDWQTQGTHIHQNIYHKNGLDFFVEVSHGPYLVDNNIFASDHALRNFSQGGAYVNNLIAGVMERNDVRDRATPYHLPHSTKVKGYAVIYGGDDRFYNNIFSGNDNKKAVGTSEYNGHTTSLSEYIKNVQEKAPTDLEGFIDEKDPVYISHNMYLNKATSFEKEKSKKIIPNFKPNVALSWQEEGLYLQLDLPKEYTTYESMPVDTSMLGRTRITDAEFENSDGTPWKLIEDLCGQQRNHSGVGPLANLKAGTNHCLIWNN